MEVDASDGGETPSAQALVELAGHDDPLDLGGTPWPLPADPVAALCCCTTARFKFDLLLPYAAVHVRSVVINSMSLTDTAGGLNVLTVPWKETSGICKPSRRPDPAALPTLAVRVAMVPWLECSTAKRRLVAKLKFAYGRPS
jgi:hypothetical protein